MEKGRPNPEELLQQITKVENQENCGKLKIFFGYAAGVGKTYAMLMAAHAAKEAGIDVVAGYIEPHTRPETMALVNGLEQIPVSEILHKGIKLKEFNLEEAIKRKPSLVLVDELAHTNAEECRHIKRYQDINELLKSGINVYTTVNVQHIESLNDIVASITGVIVRERIPDHVFDNADQVELVDIEPANLIERLNQGKVYREPQVQNALNHFFDIDNLTALREIALRRTADRVNKKSIENKHTADKGNYFTGEHILICISTSPSNSKVIRTASRMATAFHGNFTALYVEKSNAGSMTEDNKKRLRSNLKLAEQLGARIVTVYGDDVAVQTAEYVKFSGVSKVILGRTNAKKKFGIPKTTFSDKLSALAPSLDIYIIPDKEVPPYSQKRAIVSGMDFSGFSVSDSMKTLFLLLASTLVGICFDQLGFSEANIITVYILGVLLTSLSTTNRVYSLVSSILSVLTFNFFFTFPRYSLAAYDTGYPVTFLTMFIAAFITGTLTMKSKEQMRRSSQKAYRTEILLETSQKLQRAGSRELIIAETAGQMSKLLDRTIIFYDANEKGLMEPIVFPGRSEEIISEDITSEDEKAVAKWVYKNNKHAGASTNTLPGAICLYLAVRGNEKVFAVVGIVVKKNSLEAFEHNLMIAMLNECALAIEKEMLNETQKEAAMKAQQEQLRANLLRAISHDLRTPLTSISGNAGILVGNSQSMEESKKMKIYTDIYDDSIWLINLVENLLSVTRIDDGTINIHMEGELVNELIEEALHHISRDGVKHKIEVKLEDDLIMAKVDSRLIIQVIINIVDNAIKYTPEMSEIVIMAKKQADMVIVEISDNGPGIPNCSKEKLFDMFYKVDNAIGDSRRGLGLGLALCRSIITVHDGQIEVLDNFPQGTIFRFRLHAEEVMVYE